MQSGRHAAVPLQQQCRSRSVCMSCMSCREGCRVCVCVCVCVCLAVCVCVCLHPCRCVTSPTTSLLYFFSIPFQSLFNLIAFICVLSLSRPLSLFPPLPPPSLSLFPPELAAAVFTGTLVPETFLQLYRAAEGFSVVTMPKGRRKQIRCVCVCVCVCECVCVCV